MKIHLAAAATVALAAPCAHAHTVAVGDCVTGATSLLTITAAIAAVGSNGTVKICPGTYPEQLTITKSVKLVGVASAHSSQVLIVPPSLGLTNNAPDLDGGFPTAAQIAVQNNATVSISNVTVDAAGNAVGTNGCAWDIVGIIYQNASGTLTNNIVRNDFLTPFSTGGGLGGCQDGLGIYVQSSTGTSTVKMIGNTVENYQKNGITADDAGTSVTLTGNTVLGMGPTGGAAENSIQVAYGATGTLTANIVGDDIWAPDTFGDTGDAAAGILIYASNGVTLSSNRVSSTQYGIAVVGEDNGDADGAIIMNNIVRNTYLYDGIDICGAGSATVTGNSVNASDEAAVHVDGTCGMTPSAANTVSGNTINGACAAILEGPDTATPSLANNSSLNAGSLVMTGSDVCQTTAAAMAHVSRHTRRHARPFRPLR